MISIVTFSKRHNFVKMYMEWFLFSVHHLMMLHICTKFPENVSEGSELLRGHNFCSEIFKVA